MTSHIERALTVFFEDPEASIACFSGSITESLTHPRGIRKVVPYLIKASVVGYMLATFVSPAIEERFNLTKNEAIATSFIIGYAGIRILAATERLAEKELERRLGKDKKDDVS
jgi:hypothetical protein